MAETSWQLSCFRRCHGYLLCSVFFHRSSVPLATERGPVAWRDSPRSEWTTCRKEWSPPCLTQKHRLTKWKKKKKPSKERRQVAHENLPSDGAAAGGSNLTSRQSNLVSISTSLLPGLIKGPWWHCVMGETQRASSLLKGQFRIVPVFIQKPRIALDSFEILVHLAHVSLITYLVNGTEDNLVSKNWLADSRTRMSINTRINFDANHWVLFKRGECGWVLSLPLIMAMDLLWQQNPQSRTLSYHLQTCDPSLPGPCSVVAFSSSQENLTTGALMETLLAWEGLMIYLLPLDLALVF